MQPGRHRERKGDGRGDGERLWLSAEDSCFPLPEFGFGPRDAAFLALYLVGYACACVALFRLLRDTLAGLGMGWWVAVALESMPGALAASIVAMAVLGYHAVTYACGVPDALDGARAGAVGFAVTLMLPTRGVGLTLAVWALVAVTSALEAPHARDYDGPWYPYDLAEALCVAAMRRMGIVAVASVAVTLAEAMAYRLA